MTSISGLHFLLLTPNPRLCLRQNVRSAPIFGPGIQLMAFTRWHEGRLQHTWTRRSRGALHIVAAVKKSSAKNVACSKTLVADAGKEAAVDALCQKMVAYTRERQADRTAGIMTFEYSKVNIASGSGNAITPLLRSSRQR